MARKGEKLQPFLTVKKVAQILKVTPKTIRKWAQDNILSGIKLGPRGDWRFTPRDIKNLIKRKKDTP